MNRIWRFLAGILAAALAGASMAVLLMQPQDPSPPRTAIDEWSLAKPPAIEPIESAFLKLERHVAWKDAPINPRTGRAVAAAAKQWSLLGTVSRRGEWLALIQADGEVKRYIVGDTLPDDSILKTVGSGYIDVMKNEQNERIRIFDTPKPSR